MLPAVAEVGTGEPAHAKHRDRGVVGERDADRAIGNRLGVQRLPLGVRPVANQLDLVGAGEVLDEPGFPR